MAERRARGGPGSNQYGVKGASTARPASGRVDAFATRPSRELPRKWAPGRSLTPPPPKARKAFDTISVMRQGMAAGARANAEGREARKTPSSTRVEIINDEVHYDGRRAPWPVTHVQNIAYTQGQTLGDREWPWRGANLAFENGWAITVSLRSDGDEGGHPGEGSPSHPRVYVVPAGGIDAIRAANLDHTEWSSNLCVRADQLPELINEIAALDSLPAQLRTPPAKP